MNLLARTALGLDLTDGTLKAVLLARRGRRVELLRCWRKPWAHEPDQEAGRRAALAAFLKAARPGVLTRVVVSAPDRGHLGCTYTLPVVESSRVKELVSYELQRNIELPEEELLLAHHLRKGVVESQVHALALERGRVNQLVASLQELGVCFDELQPPGWALASFVEHEQPLGRDRILLAVGELASTLVLQREDGLWSRHLPFGLTDAEQPAELARRLHTEVASAISWFLPRDREFDPVDVVLTEEAALSGEVTSALRRAFELPVTRFAELRRIACPTRRPERGVSPAQALCMGRAYGLALAGLGLARVSGPLDVGPDPRRVLSRRLPLAAASLLISAAALFGLTEMTVAHAGALRASLPTDLLQQVVQGDRRARELDADAELQRARLARLSEFAARRGASFRLRSALAAVSEVAATRGDLTLHVDDCWFTAATTGQPGLIELDLSADPAFDDQLGGALTQAFARVQLPVRVSSQSQVGGSPEHSATLWRVELELP